MLLPESHINCDKKERRIFTVIDGSSAFWLWTCLLFFQFWLYIVSHLLNVLWPFITYKTEPELSVNNFHN